MEWSGNVTTILQHSNDTSKLYLERTLRTVNTIQSSLILLFNTLLFFFIITNTKLRKKPQNKFFIHLQVIHVNIGILQIVCFSVDQTDYIVENVLLISMFISLLLITADRLAALRFPYRYRSLSGTIVLRIIIISWLPSVCFAVTATVQRVTLYDLNMIHSVLIGIASLILAAANSMVLVITKKHRRFMKKHSTVHLDKHTCRNSTMKASYVCFAVVLNFIVFWMPHCVHDIIEMTSSSVNHNFHDVQKNKGLEILVRQLKLFTSLSDPIFFIFMSPQTRKEAKRFIETLMKNYFSINYSDRTAVHVQNDQRIQFV